MSLLIEEKRCLVLEEEKSDRARWWSRTGDHARGWCDRWCSHCKQQRELDKNERKREKGDMQKYTRKSKETEDPGWWDLRICCRVFEVRQPTLESTGGDGELRYQVYTDDADCAAIMSRLRLSQQPVDGKSSQWSLASPPTTSAKEQRERESSPRLSHIIRASQPP